jgi:hypothetical protein
MTNPFTVGVSIFKGLVEPSPCTSFDEFARTLSVPVSLTVTRADYATLPDEDQKSLKRVKFFTAGRYPEAGRKAEMSPVDFSVVALDLEDKPGQSSDWSALEELSARLPWPYYAYHTISSAPGRPRVRLLVACERTRVDLYPDAARTVADIVGLPTDPASFRPTQAMFWPTAFADQDNTPVVSARLTGPPFGPDDIVPSEDAAEDEETSGTRGPGNHVTLTMVRSALTHVSPDCSYTDWCAVCCGLRHQFPGEGERDAALALFLEWSAGLGGHVSSKFPGAEEVRKQWRAFAPVGKRKSITIKTLLSVAAVHGWSPSECEAEVYASIVQAVDRLRFQQEIEPFLHMVAFHPVLREIQVKSLMGVLAKKLGDSGLLTNVTKSELMRDITAIRAAVVVAPPENSWCKSWWFVASSGCWYNTDLRNLCAIRPEGFRTLHTERDIGDASSVEKFAIANGATVALKMVYDPTTDVLKAPLENGNTAMNTYRPDYAAEDPEHADQAGELFDAHLARLFPNPLHAGVLKSWMAWVIQNPGAKVMWSPVICGPQGVGKSLLGGILKACLGPSNVRVVTSTMLEQQWSDWSYGAICLLMEEIYTKARGVADKLKLLITDPMINVIEKNISTRVEPNHANLVFFLNDLSTFAIDPAERRYFVLQTHQTTPEQVAEFGESYWASVWRLTSVLAGAIRSHLLACGMHPAFLPHGRAPVTPAFIAAATAAAESDGPIATLMADMQAGDVPGVRTYAVVASRFSDYGGAARVGPVLTKMGMSPQDVDGDTVWMLPGTTLPDDFGKHAAE